MLLESCSSQIKPGIISGMLIAFTMSIDDFVISFFTTKWCDKLSNEVYSMTRKLTPEINALSTLMFVAVLILLLLSNLAANKRGSKVIIKGGHNMKLKKIISLALTLWCHPLY